MCWWCVEGVGKWLTKYKHLKSFFGEGGEELDGDTSWSFDDGDSFGGFIIV